MMSATLARVSGFLFAAALVRLAFAADLRPRVEDTLARGVSALVMGDVSWLSRPPILGPASSLLKPGSVAAQDHVVTMHQGGAARKAQDGGNLARLLADDARRVVARVGHETAAELAPVGATDDDGVAALEGALHPLDARRQQALAREQGFLRPDVDLHDAPGLEPAGDPTLAGGDGIGRGEQPGARSALGQRAQGIGDLAGDDHHAGAGRQRDLARL